ncbi:contractile injection system tape measure protein [Algibacter sp. 2305UL17-15]|uniref:contractile injection system tape measure protein n=1 Tax=Algibacter sp. 2305UL17-15 TaxID=3231268 RepID=UPI00345A232C
MDSQKHIINKVFLEVNTNSSKEAFALKDNLSVFLKHQLFPKIESYFDTQNKILSGSSIRFNKIEININQAGIVNLNALKNDIVNQLKKKIDFEIQNTANHTEDQNELVVLSKTKSTLDSFIYFLRTGAKPWWQSNISDLFDEKGIETIISEPGFSSKFIKVLAFEKAKQRLLNQFGDDILWRLLATSNSKKTVSKRKVFSVLKKNSTLRDTFWIAVIDGCRLNTSSRIKTMLHQFAATKTIDSNERQALENFATSIINKPLNDKKNIELPPEKEVLTNENPTEEALYINNAGLVLLHPFLKQFFMNAKLADATGKIIESEVETAIHLLHYLSTKQEQQLESELVLEKFLCGYPINKSMQRFIELPQELKHMGEEVLQAAITHWDALKSTSPDGLRTGFLQREGKLIIENNTCKLIVERKGQDILLDKIPWNIHLIKLPWLDNLIVVEW